MPELRFNGQIYKREAIEKAIAAYARLAEFNIKEKNKYAIVNIKKIHPKVKDVLKDEFANYVLALNRNAHRT